MKNKTPKTKRRFVFIDESGDAGFPGLSDYFQINIVVVDDNCLMEIEKEYTLYKYFMDHYGELKKKANVKNDKVKNLLEKISNIEGVNFYIYKIDKIKYNGLYRDDQKRFRNSTIKVALQNIKEITESNVNIEIIIDRYIDSQHEEQKLFKYLNDEYKNILPKFLHISQADSRCCHPIQILDVLGTFSLSGKLDKTVYIDVGKK